MKIKQWLPGFVARHHARHPRSDWPSPDDGRYSRLWLDALLAIDPKPKEAEAEAASRELKGDVLDFPEDHPIEMAFAIVAARKRPSAAKAPEPPEPAPPMFDLERQRREFAESPYRKPDGHWDWRAMVKAQQEAAP